MHEISPHAIREATLTRRLRGYDREETEKLLAMVADSYEKVDAERMRLSEEVVSLREERQESEARLHVELDRLNEQVSERDRHIADLDAQVARLEAEQSKQLEDLDRLRKELSNVRTVQEEVRAESRDQGERVARFALREKALVEQIAMLVSQLSEGRRRRRRRRSRDTRGRFPNVPIEQLRCYFGSIDSSKPEVSDDSEPNMGEASWTSRAVFDETSEPSR